MEKLVNNIIEVILFKIFLNILYLIIYFNIKGKNIIAHCRGGIGRAGLIAACFLIKIDNSFNDKLAI